MRIIVGADYADLSRRAADLAAAVIRERPDASMVVATGESPMGMYRELGERKLRGEVGMAALLAARQTMLLVSGERKRAILWRVTEGPIAPDVPASYLQRANNVTVFADRDATSFSSGGGR